MTRALVLVIALGACAAAAALVAVPPLGARVTDQTGTLSAEQKASLERTLQAFEARKGSQIVVLMVPSTAPETVEQFALRVAEQWRPGRRKIDDGALLLVAKDDRALRIEVGYGLEGALNDAAARRIVSGVIAPRLSEGDFFGGIAAGVDRMIRVVDGEPLPPAGAPQAGRQGIAQMLPALLVVAVVAGMALRSMLGRFPGAIATGGAVGFLAWLLANAIAVALIAGVAAFLFTLLGAGGYGGMHGGHGGFGGLRRGGFGGGFRGGGGGFGGGGASGRW